MCSKTHPHWVSTDASFNSSLFTMEDETGNSEVTLEMIKYTPKFGSCLSVFYSPMNLSKPPSLGISTVQNSQLPHLRHRSHRLNQNSVQDHKKLKLIDEAFNKNTTFVKVCLTPVLKPPSSLGSFRAIFEDKILMSDLIFCRTWYSIDVPKLYNPIAEEDQAEFVVQAIAVRGGEKRLGETQKTSARPAAQRVELASYLLQPPGERLPCDLRICCQSGRARARDRGGAALRRFAGSASRIVVSRVN